MSADPSSPDLYTRLGVSPEAGQEEIRAAFKSVRKELHPDGKPDSLQGHFNAMMSNINEAHQTLTDSKARAKYDRRRADRRDEDAAKTANDDAEPGRDEASSENSSGDHYDDGDPWAEWESQDDPEHEHSGADDFEDEPQSDPDPEDAWSQWEQSDSGHDEEPYDDSMYDADPEPASRRTAPDFSRSRDDGGGLLYKLPTVAHTAAIYVTTAWAWAALLVGLLIFGGTGGGILGIIIAIVVPALAYWQRRTWLSSLAIERVLMMVAGSSPLMASRVDWFGATVLRALFVGPALIIAMWLLPGAIGNALYTALTIGGIAAAAYTGLWIAEVIKTRGNRRVR